MRHLVAIIAAAALLLGCISCEKVGSQISEEEPVEIVEEPTEGSYKGMDLPTKSASILEQGNAFAFRFLSRVEASTEGSYIVSPLSLQFLLGLVLNGAQGTTADQICQVLGYGAGEMIVMNDFARAVLDQLPSLDEKTTVNIANSVVVNKAYSVLDSYKTAVVEYYDADVSNRDFLDAATLHDINQWAYDNTNGLIPKVLDELDASALSYLLNALYFKGVWKEPFDKQDTSTKPFTNEKGEQVSVPMMKQEGKYIAYREESHFRAVNLPYGNGAFSMTVVLPSAGFTVADVLAELSGEMSGFIGSMSGSTRVNLWLPKFEITSHINLNGILSEMGMPLAFSSFADFGAMSPDALCLSAVMQDAIIKVDEEGTEAAAVTTGVVATSVPAPPVDFHADHPFLYLISESSTGVILFAGKYTGGD